MGLKSPSGLSLRRYPPGALKRKAAEAAKASWSIVNE